MASAEQFIKVGNIIRADKERSFVVPSAPGKRFSADTKVTDMLYACYALAEAGKNFAKELDAIKARYQEIIDGLHLELSLEEEFKVIEKNFKDKAGSDYAASRGEYLNGIIMAAYLGYEFIDSAEVIFFKEDGEFDAEVTNEVLSARLAECKNAVVPGFYGAYADGRVKTFSRGGSDITGSIVAKAIKADVYENWTDVSGILMVDPRIVKDPETIARVTFDELRELSYMGASVLHEDTVFPVRSRDIPVNIRNTNAPEDPGTIIREHFDDELKEETERFITGIAGKRNFSIISIYKNRIGEEKLGLLRQVLEIFDRYEIPVEQVPSGVDSFSVVFPGGKAARRIPELMQELEELESIDNCSLTEGISLIAIVGRQMAYRVGISGKIFKTLGDNRINIRTIEQCADEINIMVGVYDEDFEKAISVLYESFAK